MDNFKKFRRTLSDNLSRLIESGKYKKTALAQVTGIGRPSIDAILNISSNPSLETICRIADAYEISLLELLSPDLFSDSKSAKRKSVFRQPVISLKVETLVQNLASLRETIKGIPADILEALVGQNEDTYDAVRAMLDIRD
jgi:transcriptional regulator with XRE-family HTH domain